MHWLPKPRRRVRLPYPARRKEVGHSGRPLFLLPAAPRPMLSRREEKGTPPLGEVPYVINDPLWKNVHHDSVESRQRRSVHIGRLADDVDRLLIFYLRSHEGDAARLHVLDEDGTPVCTSGTTAQRDPSVKFLYNFVNKFYIVFFVKRL